MYIDFYSYYSYWYAYEQMDFNEWAALISDLYSLEPDIAISWIMM